MGHAYIDIVERDDEALARLAFKLEALPGAATSPSLVGRLQMQRLVVAQLLDRPPLPLLGRVTVELRFTKQELTDGIPSIDVFLLCVVAAKDKVGALAAGRAYAAHASDVFSHETEVRGYRLAAVEREGALSYAFLPFEVVDYGEIRRDESVLAGGTEIPHGTALFEATTSANEIIRALLAHRGDAFAGIAISPATPDAVDLHAAAELLQHPDPEGPRHGWSSSLEEVHESAIALDLILEAHSRLETLARRAYRVRVHAASNRALSASLVNTIAAETVGPGSLSDPMEEVGGDWSWVRPRSHPGAANASSEHAIAMANLQYLEFVPWQTRAVSATIFTLADELEVVRLLAFPTRDAASAVLLPATTLRGLPPDPALPSSGTVLGASPWMGRARRVALSAADRASHLWIVGQTGTGKTTLLESLATQDMHAGKGVIVVDPHGDFTASLLGRVPHARREDVIVFDPSDREYPLGMNLLEAASEDEWPFLINSFIGLLYKLFDPNRQGIIGPRFEHAARNAMMTVMSQEGGTLVDVLRVLTDPSYVEAILPNVRDPLVRAYWTHEIRQTSDFHRSEVLGYFVSKFSRFVTDTSLRLIIGQSRSAFDFRRAMDERKIAFISLAKGRLGAENSTFLGMVVLLKILLAALSRVDRPEAERSDVALYVDEFQNFSSDALASMLAEARKYSLAVTLANQHVGQIDRQLLDAVLGNCGSIIAFRTGWKDAVLLSEMFQPSPLGASDFALLPNFHAYARLLAGGRPRPPCLLAPEHPPVASDANLAAALRSISRARYGVPRKLVEQRMASAAE
jgi:energy-coupling factor transporter ATP-binding protein EcfA2